MRISATAFRHRPRLRIGRASFVWNRRVAGLLVFLLALAALLFAVSVTVGDYPLTPAQVWDILRGGGAELDRRVVLEWRLPRAASAVLVGIALGTSGAITQSVTRNALASPDTLGITSGASAMAVTIIVLGSKHSAFVGLLAGVGTPLAAFAGALATAAVIWFLASRRGLDTFRLVLAGIIITALLHAYITLLLIKATINDAAVAKAWITGSLALTTWESATPIAVVLLVCLPLIGWVAFHLRAMTLGNDVARGLGVPVNLAQTLLLLLAVLLAAIAVSASGPIGFVAFVAPQLALRLAKVATPPLVTSAATGAVLLLAADVATRTLLPVELPVGLITAAIGGAFLLHLLIRTNRKGAQ